MPDRDAYHLALRVAAVLSAAWTPRMGRRVALDRANQVAGVVATGELVATLEDLGVDVVGLVRAVVREARDAHNGGVDLSDDEIETFAVAGGAALETMIEESATTP